MHTTAAPASAGCEQSRLHATEAQFQALRASTYARAHPGRPVPQTESEWAAAEAAAQRALEAMRPQSEQHQRAHEAQRTGRRAPDPRATRPPPKPTARAAGRTWHHRSRFPGPGDFRRLDRNDRVRVWVAATVLDRRTHTPGKHGGVLGHTGLIVLRCLLFDFLHLPTGRLDPAYETIARRANLARSTVIEAVGRLQAAGLLEVSRRIVRKRVQLPGGRSELQVRQTSNAYRVNFPTVDRDRLGDLAAAPRPSGAGSGNRTGTRQPTNQQSDSVQKPTTKVPPSCCDSVERACGPSEPGG